MSKIQYDQKIMEKESLRKMSEIEGGSSTSNNYYSVLFLCVLYVTEFIRAGLFKAQLHVS